MTQQRGREITPGSAQQLQDEQSRRELARFLVRVDAFQRADPKRMKAGHAAALVEDLGNQADRLALLLRAAADPLDLPPAIVARIPILVPSSDPDRDIGIVLTALDHCPISLSALLLGRHRETVREISSMAHEAMTREATRLLGPAFRPPPRNPRRAPKKRRR